MTASKKKPSDARRRKYKVWSDLYDKIFSARGGKGIARSRRHAIVRDKTMRLETLSPARSTPTFHHPRAEAPAEPGGNVAGQESALPSGNAAGQELALPRTNSVCGSKKSARIAARESTDVLESEPRVKPGSR